MFAERIAFCNMTLPNAHTIVITFGLTSTVNFTIWHKWYVRHTHSCACHYNNPIKQEPRFRCGYFNTHGELCKWVFLRLWIRGWRVHTVWYVAKFVLKNRWRLRITDAKPSSNFYHKVCHKIKVLIQSAKIRYHEKSFGGACQILWNTSLIPGIGVLY